MKLPEHIWNICVGVSLLELYHRCWRQAILDGLSVIQTFWIIQYAHIITKHSFLFFWTLSHAWTCDTLTAIFKTALKPVGGMFSSSKKRCSTICSWKVQSVWEIWLVLIKICCWLKYSYWNKQIKNSQRSVVQVLQSLLEVLQLRDWIWKYDFYSCRCETEQRLRITLRSHLYRNKRTSWESNMVLKPIITSDEWCWGLTHSLDTGHLKAKNQRLQLQTPKQLIFSSFISPSIENC